MLLLTAILRVWSPRDPKPNDLLAGFRMRIGHLGLTIIALVYILKLRSGALYVGCSDDVEGRFIRHANGTACTAIDPPQSVLWVEIHSDFSAARRREAQIKKWSRARKEALIANDLSQLKALSRSRD